MKILLLVLLTLVSVSATAQKFFPSKDYPNRSFRYPLDTAVSLVGNFGECRPNHFHSGIDIRTFGKENLVVHAIEDGFISRIKIEPGGFGNAIYVTHLNGYTSLYAHLNRFFPELEAYVRRKQYETKSWKQDLMIPPHEFPIRKGKSIAWSGNTGSSSGPHLHMEIRDTKTEAPLNGLLFYNSIPDNKPPTIKLLAIYDGTQSIYEQKPTLVNITKVGNEYKPAKETIQINSSKAFVGIRGDDYMAVATGTLGIFETRVFVDGQPFFGWQMDNINYDITRYMNAIADYKVKKNGGPWIQLCRKLPNDKLNVYKLFSNSNGVIDLSDGIAKKIRIEVFDTKYNSTSTEFYLQGNSMVNTPTCETKFTQGKVNNFSNSNIELSLKEDCLYDDICFITSIKNSSNPYSHIYQVHYPYVPLHSYFELKLKPKSPLPASLSEKIAVVKYPYTGETNKKGKAGKLVDGKVIVQVRDFGEYEIVIDDKAPTITSTIKNGDNIGNSKRLNFVAKDETTSIANCEATCDGQWLRLVQRGDNYYYELDDYFPKGTHQFMLAAFDENNNKKTVSYTLTR
jgi:murein DD-endopeptidase MepM/ murein hydrolase activator NlpD